MEKSSVSVTMLGPILFGSLQVELLILVKELLVLVLMGETCLQVIVLESRVKSLSSKKLAFNVREEIV
jgi:hypothetical protein